MRVAAAVAGSQQEGIGLAWAVVAFGAGLAGAGTRWEERLSAPREQRSRPR